jgi:hypothetical protein
MNLSIDLIEPGQRLREVSPAKVAELVASIGEVGLLNPVTVYPRTLYRSGNPVDGYGLIAGAHRLEAFRQMGRTEIPATVLELGDSERLIAEADENLQGPHLTPAERARFIRQRKFAYDALHPELATPKKGAGGRFAKVETPPSRQVGDMDESPVAQGFVADTAKATGISERTIQREAEPGQKILPEVLDMIEGTPLNTGAYLDKLKAMPGNEQHKAAKRDLAELQRKAKEATPEHKARERAKKQAAKLFELWTKAPDDARTMFKKQAGLVGMVHPAKSLDGKKLGEALVKIARVKFAVEDSPPLETVRIVAKRPDNTR